MEQKKQSNQQEFKNKQGKGSEAAAHEQREVRESLNNDDEIDDTMMRSSAASDELDAYADEGFQGQEKAPATKPTAAALRISSRRRRRGYALFAIFISNINPSYLLTRKPRTMFHTGSSHG